MGQTSGAPMIPNLMVAGRTFTDLTNLIVLNGICDNTNQYATLRLPNGTSGYQVPASRTLRILAVSATFSVVTGAAAVSIGYGDTDVGFSAASAPTTPVSLSNGGRAMYVGAGALKPPYEMATNFTVPTGKYPYVSNSLSLGSITVYGYLE